MRPTLICLTPVKNEAWILDTFLTYTSEWADHIIIADQNSSDNSKEIALKYPKVIYVENKSSGYNEVERQHILINEARKIPGPKLLFTLDADEVFSLNYKYTADWQRILASEPGDVFGFQWATINSDKQTYFSSSFYYPWVVYDTDCKHDQYVGAIHSMRIPLPSSAHNGWQQVTEFNVLHFSRLSLLRSLSKNRYYQCIHSILESRETPVSLYRSYNFLPRKNQLLIDNWVRNNSGSVFDKIDLSPVKFWWDEEVINLLASYGTEKFKYLGIWDDPDFAVRLEENGMRIERTASRKIFHQYLKLSQRLYPSLFIAVIDKLFLFFLKPHVSN